MSTNNHDDDGNAKRDGNQPYDIGYGKPPKQHQFKKGQSGNPRGRKPRIKNASTLVQIELDKLVVVRDGDKERKITKREAFITSLVNDAITGKKPSARSDLFKFLNVSPPPEPFVASDDDDDVLNEFIERLQNQRRRKDETGDDGEGGPSNNEQE